MLVVPSAFPSEEDASAGVFVRDHASAAATHSDVLVFYMEPHSARAAAAVGPDSVRSVEAGVVVVRVRVRLPSSPRVLRLAFYPAFFRSALRAYRRINPVFSPDVIHAHDLFPGGFLGVLLGRALRVPLVLTIHSTHFGEIVRGGPTSWLARYTLARARLILAVSEALRREVQAAGVPSRRTRVIPNPVWVSPAGFVPSRDRRGSEVRIVVVARLSRRKGVDYLLRAAALLAEEHGCPPFTIDIVGDGAERSNLERLAGELGIDRVTSFRGELGRAQVREALRESDFLALPSLKETFGVVIVEAMAEGKPVLATRCGGPEEIVDEEVGLLVEPGKTGELVSGLRHMVHHFGDYDPTAIVERARSRYSHEAVGRELLLYRSVAEGPLERPERERRAGVRDHG